MNRMSADYRIIQDSANIGTTKASLVCWPASTRLPLFPTFLNGAIVVGHLVYRESSNSQTSATDDALAGIVIRHGKSKKTMRSTTASRENPWPPIPLEITRGSRQI